MRTIYDRNVSWVEKEKMGTENVSIFLQAVTKHSHLYTKEKVEEIKQVMMNEFPLYVFEGAVLKEFLNNATFASSFDSIAFFICVFKSSFKLL